MPISDSQIQYRKLLPKGRQQGFVLVGTLIFLSLMAVLAYFFSNTVDRALSLAFRQEQRFEAELMRLSAEQTALYLYSTRIRLPGGIYTNPDGIELDAYIDDFGDLDFSSLRPNIFLSGEAYNFDENIIVRLQDEAGLASMANPSSPFFRQVLQASMLRARDYSLIQDRLMDFTDEDDFSRLNGAERDQYQGSSLRSPTNTDFKSPLEIWNVLGFEEYIKAEQWVDIQNQLTPVRSFEFNPNAINLELLDYLGWDETLKNEYDTNRREKPFTTKREAEIFFNFMQDLAADQFRFFPSNYVRITTQAKDSGVTYSSGYSFNFINQRTPWELSYRVINLEEPHLGITSKAETPLF